MRQPSQRQRQLFVANLFEEMRHQTVDRAEDVFLLDERHLDVDLSELRLPIGSQVFVAESFARAMEALAPFVRDNGLPELDIGGAEQQLVTLARAFDRFWRAPDARQGGSGIGLAVVQQLAKISGGRAELRNRTDRSGLDASAVFPSA